MLVSRSLLLSVAFATASITTAASAQVDAREQARSAFNRGVERYEAADYQAALVAFEEAFRLAPHPAVRVNMANCYERLGRPIEAIAHYERFLAEGQNVPERQRREVEQTLATLRLQVGTVRLLVRPEGASVRVDGELRAAAEPLSVLPGPHTIEVSLDGYTTSTREIAVAGGRTSELSIELERTPIAEPIAEPPVEPEPEPDASEPAESAAGLANADQPYVTDEVERDEGGGFRLETPTVIAGALSAAVLVTAAVLGILALGAQSDFDDSDAIAQDTTRPLDERARAYADSVDASDRADALSLTADILGIAGIVGLGVTGILFFAQDDESGESARLGIAPIASREAAGVVLNGGF
jgi:hypothetical protein